MSDQVREAFEKYAKGFFGAYRIGKVEGFYSCKEVQDCWFSWQEAWTASRASIVVTLPETHNDWLDKQIVQHALKKEGIRYE